MSSYDKIKDMDLAALERPGQEMQSESADSDALLQTEDPAAEPAESVKDPDQEDLKKTDREQEQKKDIMEPQGQHYYVDADFTDRHWISFVVAHTYRRPYMIILTIIGILSPIYAMINHRGSIFFSIACLIVFVVYFPATTYLRGKNARAMNPVYSETYHYMFDEWGVHLKIMDDAVDVAWDRVIKMVFLKEIIVLYTGKNNAFLVPYACMEDREAITAFIKAKGEMPDADQIQ